MLGPKRRTDRASSLLVIAGLFIGVAILASSVPVQAESIAAVVNDDVVTTRQLQQRARMAMAVSGVPATEENFQQIAPQILSALINEELQMQEAERLNIEVAETEVDAQFGEIAQRNNMTADQLAGALQGSGITPDTLRDQIRARLAWVMVARQQVASRVIITEGQIAATMRQAVTGQSEFRLAEIFLPIFQPDQENRVTGDARRIVTALQRGADFGALAQQFSAAPSAARGGDLGWLPVSGLPPELRDRVGAMVDGEVTPPIRTQQGIYLFKRLGIRGGGPGLQLDLVDVTASFSNADELEVRQAFDALRLEAQSCDALTTQVEAQPGISATRRSAVSPDALGEPFATNAITQPDGVLGLPVDREDGLRAVMVCSRSGAGDLPSPDAVQQRLTEEQMDRLATRYLRNLRQDAFIDIRI